MPSRYGTSSAVLPPDQNPAYQSAIAKGRPNTSAYSWITTPSGGQMRVPNSFAWQPKTGTALEGSFVNPATGPLTQDQYASNWNKGNGAPAPSFNATTGTLASGGVETPVEALTIPQRSQLPNSNPFLEQWGANFAAQNPRLAAFGTLASNAFKGLFGGGNMPSIPPSMPAQPATIPAPLPSGYNLPPNPFTKPTNLYANLPMQRYSDNFGYNQ